MKDARQRKISTLSSEKAKDLTFYIVMFALPVIQFCIFYIGVNLNSILLAFKEYSRADNSYTFVAFDNFKNVFNTIAHNSIMHIAFRNSLIKFALHIVIGVPCALIFSYYIFKKMPGSVAFRIILFMPSVIAPIVLTLIFNYFVDRALPEYVMNIFGKDIPGLIADDKTSLPVIFFYSVWVGFGVSVLMYTSTMCGIDDSIIESAELDGANNLREFFSIALPLVWPTITTFLTISVAQVFVDQNNIFSFFGERADEKYYNIGYYLYVNVQSGTQAGYPVLAALGIVLTVIITPVTLVVKRCLEKFGPSAD